MATAAFSKFLGRCAGRFFTPRLDPSQKALSCAVHEQKGNPRWISIHTDRPLQMTSPHPLQSRHSDLGGCASIPRDTRGRRPRQGAASGSTFPWDSGTAPEREARTNDYVPPSSTPSMIDEIMPSQCAYFTVGTTRRQRMRCLSSLAWPPLL